MKSERSKRSLNPQVCAASRPGSQAGRKPQALALILGLTLLAGLATGASLLPTLAEPILEPIAGTVVPGCGQNTSVNYSSASGFNEDDFDRIYTSVDPFNKWLVLDNSTIDRENPKFIVPFTQRLSLTAIYNGSGIYGNKAGWMYAKDLPANQSADPDPAKMYKIYEIPGEWREDIMTGFGQTVEQGGNALVDYYDFRNNRVVLSEATAFNQVNRNLNYLFPAGAEIVFWFSALQPVAGPGPQYYYTKKGWNDGVLNGVYKGNCWESPDLTFPDWVKKYQLGVKMPPANEGTCFVESQWMTEEMLDIIKENYGLDFGGATAELRMLRDQKFQHALIGLAVNKPNEWIIGWEDIIGGGDLDMNDIIFHVERQAGGVAQLKNPIVPANSSDFITAVDVTVIDYIPKCAVGATAAMPLRYYVSVNNGASWVEITQWDDIGVSDSAKAMTPVRVPNWAPGIPDITYTWRKFRVDFASLGQTGRELLWKAEFRSASLGDDCRPAILDVQLKASSKSNGYFSRGAPVAKANVIYSGFYETPKPIWQDKSLRGHLTATRLYDPTNPDATNQQLLWDAGVKLNTMSPDDRRIYFPKITVGSVSGEALGTGDGSTRTFSGTLASHPVAGTTLTITDGQEIFRDVHTDLLEGHLGGTGTINRFTGQFSLTFSSAPDFGAPITASYISHAYSNPSALLKFEAENVTKNIMGLDDTYIASRGYVYDFDNNGAVDNDDARRLMNWVRGYKLEPSTPPQKREWLLGSIDHSVPALVTPPGLPLWYFGTATTKQERASYDTFRQDKAERPTVVFVGARDGMLHAFNAGKFRYGDNPCTTVEENRGFFKWAGTCPPIPDSTDSAPDYGDGRELWAFIPANLLPRLKNNLMATMQTERAGDTDQAYVDASPAVSDAYFGGAWRTVLLSAEGNGGDTVFCLDITDPQKPGFLWEFADPGLFRSRSSPAVGKIGRILVDGTARWVAFFVSGASDRFDYSQYPSVYMIDIATGSKIARVELNCVLSGRGGIPSGQPSIIDSDGNGYIDRFYIGTDKGFLYKVNIPDDPDMLQSGFSSLSHCVVNADFTDEGGAEIAVDQHYHPIYGSPVAVVDNSVTDSGAIDYKVKIFFGTGDSPYAEDINAAGTRYHFFTYVDRSPKGSCEGGKVSLEWFYTLDYGHRVFASAFASAGMIYFGTSTADTEDPCAGGGLLEHNKGELFAFNMNRPSPAEQVEPTKRYAVGNLVVPPLVEDQHIYIKPPGRGLVSLGYGHYNNPILRGGWPEMNVRTWREQW